MPYLIAGQFQKFVGSEDFFKILVNEFHRLIFQFMEIVSGSKQSGVNASVDT